MKTITSASSAFHRIKQGDVLNVYVTGNFASPRHIDRVCRFGAFDVLWFDLEHFDIPTRELAVMNMITRAYPISTIARLKATDYQVVMRMLETGIDGLMCSMVADAGEARRIVSWAKFNNPQPGTGEAVGMRGWNGGNIDSAYGTTSALDYMRQQNNETAIICQIEYPAALEQAYEIASVPGVDGLFFGPGDFAATTGVAGQINHPSVMKAMAQMAAAAEKAGKWWGTIAPGKDMYAEVRALGARFVCPGGDVKVMSLGLKALMESFQGAPKAAEPVNGPVGSSVY